MTVQIENRERFPTGNPAKPVVPQASSDRLWSAGTLTYTLAGLVALFAWLLWGDFAIAMRDRSFSPMLQLLLKRLNASDLTMTLLMTSVPSTIGMFLSPFVSYRSHRLRRRWGRRIPYLIIPTPIAALAMVGMG